MVSHLFRLATYNDIDKICELTQNMCIATNEPHCPGKIKRVIEHYFYNDNDVYFVIMVNKNNTPVGVLVLNVSESIFSDDVLEVTEIWWYISTGYVHLGLRMIKFVESLFKDESYKSIQIVLSPPYKKSSAILQKSGYIKKNETLIKDLKHGIC